MPIDPIYLQQRLRIECPDCGQEHTVADEAEAVTSLREHLDAGTEKSCAWWADLMCLCGHVESAHERECLFFSCECETFMNDNLCLTEGSSDHAG